MHASRLAVRGSALTKNERVAEEEESLAPAPGAPTRRRSDARLREIEPQIGRALKSVYDQTVDEAVPSDLLDLLGRLD